MNHETVVDSPPAQGSRTYRHAPPWLVAVLVLCIGASFSTLWARSEASKRLAEARVDFAHNADRLEREILRRIGQSEAELRGIAAITAAAGPFSVQDFSRYVTALDLPRQVPGLQGVGFIERVPRADLAAFVARARGDGAPEVRAQADGRTKDDLFVVRYIEPQPPRRVDWRRDIGTDPARWSAAQAAIRSGRPTLTGRLQLDQDGHPESGWWLLAPVYRPDADLSTPALRELALKGLVYAPLVASKTLEAMATLVDGEVDFELLDEVPSSPAEPESPPRASRFTDERQLNVAGRTLTLQLRSSPSFDTQADLFDTWVIAGLDALVSLLLAALAWALAASRARVLQAASGMTRDIERLASVLARTSNAVVGIDRDARITWINEGFTRLSGYRADEAVGHTVTELIGHPKADPWARAQLRHGIENGQGCRVEILNRHKNGSDYWVETELQPTCDSEGRINGFIEIALDVTERKLGAQRIAASEAFLAQAERIAGVGGWEVDIASSTLRVTPQLRRIFGIPEHQPVTVDDFLAFFEPADRARIEALTTDCVKSGHGWDVVMRTHEASGPQRWIRTFGEVEREDQRSIRLIGVLQDITERHAMEEELRKQNALLTNILENLPCGLSVFDQNLILVASNRQFRTLLDFPADMFEDRQTAFEDLIRFNARRGEYGLGDTEDQVRDIVARTIEPVPHDIDRIRPDGTRLEIRGRPLPGGGFVTTYTDVTAREAIKEALRDSEDLLRLVIDNIPARLAYWDREQRCRFVNRAFCETLHATQEELLGRTMLELLGPEHHGAIAPLVQDTLAGNPQQFERTERNARGEDEETLVHYVPDARADGVRGYFVLAMDITEIKRARDMALQASVAKGQFLANMSHEIRTPMNAVLGMLLLLRGTRPTPPQMDYLQKAERAARSLLEILNDILDYSKVESGKLSLEQRPFEVDDLLRHLSVILSVSKYTKDVDILFDVDPDLPPRLVGDALRLQQILVNLGGNAVKFTERGVVVIGLQLLSRAAGSARVAFWVSDTGIGIAPENQARIFSGFTQAEASTTRRFGGTGLGLVISQRLVQLMGGQIHLDSALGQGSRFAFDLELGTDGVASAPWPAPSQRVLFVDDNPVALRVHAAMATSLGWSAMTASSGGEALDILSRDDAAEPLAAIFIDWRMPDMDGWETARRVRALHIKDSPKIVLLTAFGQAIRERVDQDALDMFDGFLVKPVTASMLRDAVNGDFSVANTPGEAPSAGNRPLAGLHILLAEDNPTNQQIALELLQAQGALVDVAGNGRDALDRAVRRHPGYDLVLMDVQMPVMDGLEATRQLRAHPGLSRLPIVAMTANAMPDEREACLQAGMNDHVGKPFELDELVRCILRHVAHASAPSSPTPQDLPTDLGAREPETADIDAAVERLGGDWALYREVYEAFRTDAQALLEQLDDRSAAEPGDASRVLHTLRGLAGTLGMQQLARQAGNAEALVAAGDGLASEETARTIRQAVSQACACVEQRLAAGSPVPRPA